MSHLDPIHPDSRPLGGKPMHVPTDGHNHPLFHHHHGEPPRGTVGKCLFIRHDQILHDVEVQLQIVALARREENGAPNRLFNAATDQFADQFDRWIDKYLDNVKQRIAAFLVTEERHGVMNAKRKWEEVTIYLAFPQSWNDTTFEQLVGAVHDYIVNSVLFEYFALVLTSKDPLTIDRQALADDAYSNIKHYVLSNKPGTLQKKLKPF